MEKGISYIPSSLGSFTKKTPEFENHHLETSCLNISMLVYTVYKSCHSTCHISYALVYTYVFFFVCNIWHSENNNYIHLLFCSRLLRIRLILKNNLYTRRLGLFFKVSNNLQSIFLYVMTLLLKGLM